MFSHSLPLRLAWVVAVAVAMLFVGVWGIDQVHIALTPGQLERVHLNQFQAYVTLASVLLWLLLSLALRTGDLARALLFGGLVSPLWGGTLVSLLMLSPGPGWTSFMLFPLLVPVGAVTGVFVWLGVRKPQEEPACAA